MIVLCPGNMVGPSYKKDTYASAEAIKTLLSWSKIPGFGVPKVCGQFVDVRDVAKAHLLATKNLAANGKRFLIVSECLWTVEVAEFLHQEFGKYYKISNKKFRYPCLFQLLSPFNEKVKNLAGRIGPKIACDTTASKKILGLEYTPIR